MRLLSLMNPERVRSEMNFLHLANLDPNNWGVAVSTLLDNQQQLATAERIMDSLSKGIPVPLAMLKATPNDNSPRLGHAVLAYAVHEFDDYYLVLVYDPDVVYRKHGPVQTFLQVPRNGEQKGHIRYVARRKSEAVNIYPLGQSQMLSTLSGYLSRSYSSMDTKLAGQVVSHSFIESLSR